MKKIKFLAFTLMIALMLMGAGYAYWTDSLEITGTVKTGTFDVQFAGTPTVTFAANNTTAFDNSVVAAVATANVTAPANDAAGDANDKITVTLNNLYPGAQGVITFAVDNAGTIPVKFNFADINFAGSTGLVNYIETKGYIQNPNDSQGDEYFQGGVGDGSSPTQWDLLANLETQFNHNGSIESDILQETSSPLTFVVPFRVMTTLDNSADLEGKTLTMDIVLNWEQYNTNSNTNE